MSAVQGRLAAFLKQQREAVADAWYRNHFDPQWLERWDIVKQDIGAEFIREKFLGPLIDVLSAALARADEAMYAVYLDERLRYAPHLLGVERRAEFHRELVDRDWEALEKLGVARHVDQAAARDLWLERHRFLTHTGDPKRRLNVLAVGDCLLNEVRVFLPHKAAERGLEVDMRGLYMSASQTGAPDTSEVQHFIRDNAVNVVAFSFFTFEALPTYATLMRQCDGLSSDEIERQCRQMLRFVEQFLSQLRATTDIPFLLHNVSGLPLRRWRLHLPFLPPLSRTQRRVRDKLNAALQALADATPNCLLVDEAAIVRNRGLRAASRQVASQRRYGGMFHTSMFGSFLSDAHLEYLEAFARLRKAKVLCIDFDNTLWKGVMADGVVSHWPERQRLLRELKDAGMLLVALSKNSESNIRWEEMTLKSEDFAVSKISWNPKVQSIKEAQALLNLGIDSFVVIDDSTQEMALIGTELPAVVRLDSTDEASWRQLKWLLDFPNTQQTEEAQSRTRLYQEQVARTSALTADVDYPAMMASLELWYRYGPAGRKEIDRITELVQRTNQFNTTTIRYGKDQLLELLREPGVQLLTGELGDKFGGLGLVMVVILRDLTLDGEPAVLIDSFVMSCRAMGFGLEDQVLYEVAQHCRSQGKRHLIGRYIATDRNTPCAKLYERCGFVRRDERDSTLALAGTAGPPAVPWLKKRLS